MNYDNDEKINICINKIQSNYETINKNLINDILTYKYFYIINDIKDIIIKNVNRYDILNYNIKLNNENNDIKLNNENFRVYNENAINECNEKLALINERDNIFFKIVSIKELNITYLLSYLNISPKILGIYKIVTKEKIYYAFTSELIKTITPDKTIYSDELFIISTYSYNILDDKYLEIFKKKSKLLLKCGIIHKDLHKDNILISESDLYIIDFENIKIIKNPHYKKYKLCIDFYVEYI